MSDYLQNYLQDYLQGKKQLQSPRFWICISSSLLPGVLPKYLRATEGIEAKIAHRFQVGK